MTNKTAMTSAAEVYRQKQLAWQQKQIEEEWKGVPKPKFIADDRGHLKKNKVPGSSFPTEFSKTGSFGYDFTPVGYNCAAVRPNTMLEGVRPGMNNTNDTAFHYLRKNDNQQTFSKSMRVPRTEFLDKNRNPFRLEQKNDATLNTHDTQSQGEDN